jgi:hypothetical protein
MFTKKSPSLTNVTEEAIAQRAYELWEARGCPESNGDEDWQSAQAELLAEAEQPKRPITRLFARLRNRAAL